MPSKNKNKRGKIYNILYVVVIVVFIFILYNGFIGQTPVEEDGLVPVKEDQIPKINQTLLSSSILEEFHSWNVLPLQIEEAGKSNPFSR